ncbi:uncharacterized protein LOC105781500 [Gossypium raimondii]|uniref:uncharacterized protein LOC105781500 n=1 Tax=Gossypium raimondii TaxID=29730 RepID=UPI00063AAAB9|nr:uncharacterized protein LOC105781500 [Gossypium raimondii]
MRPNVVLKIKEEVQKKFDAGFLQVVKYSEWVANIVPVPKKDGKVRMCVDYKDLNKASQKDNFPLPHIDTLVDNMAGYTLFSFMDGFSGYNQSKMHPEDMTKTTFITLWGTFCYRVMPFGLKNARATYQRAMVTLFHNMMRKEMEVYVDNMIAKSQIGKEHVQVLRKLFLRLRKFQLKLNPTIFEKCDPIFRLLKKHNPGVWDEECQKAFDRVKQYLSSTPVLSPPNPNKPLILYLTVFDNSMGCVLGQQDETGRKEKAIYYLCKKFTDCESSIEKLRMSRWQILLSKFDIIYVNQKVVKRSAIADFLASRALEDYEPLDFDFPNEDLMCMATAAEDSQRSHRWKLNFDGASNVVGNRIKTVLMSPNGDQYPFTSKLDFDCTNNMVEYEACIMGIRSAIECKIKVLELYGDSALVIYQLKGEWETRDPKLISYQNLVLKLIEEFDGITFCYLPQDENQMADVLATLASMIKVNKLKDMKSIKMSIYEVPTYCYNIEEEENDSHP